MIPFSLLKTGQESSDLSPDFEQLWLQITQDLHIFPQLLAINQNKVIYTKIEPRSNVSRRAERDPKGSLPK